MTPISNGTATREILWNVSSVSDQVLLYSLFFLSMVICAWGIWSRIRVWAAGSADDSRLKNWPARFGIIWDYVLKQRGVNRRRTPRVFHTLILWGFLVLLFTTTMVFIDHDLGIRIYEGKFYLAVTVLSDLFGVALFIGVLLAYHRRYIRKPDLIHNTPSDLLMLVLLGLLVIQGYLLEGLRIKATQDPWAIYSPVGLLFSKFFWGLSLDSLRALHYGTWWFHAVTVFVFFAILPYTKFLHIVSSSANLFFRELEKPKGAIKYPGDIEKLLEAAAEDGAPEFKVGAHSISDLSWKQLLDLDACTSCGRCQSVCPAYNSGKILSPKWLILDTRDHMLKLHAEQKFGLAGNKNPLDTLDRFLVKNLMLSSSSTTVNGSGHTERAKNELVQNSAAKAIGVNVGDALAGEVLDENVFWSCTSCRACMETCPVGIEHLDYIFDARRSMALMQGNIPQEAQSSLRAIETRGNPFGKAEARAEWMEGLNVPILEAGAEVDVLYWVGCVSAYDKRKQRIARSLVKILNESGLKWGILGSKENCTGDPARRLGEENLFQTMAKKNIELLSTVKFKTMVANCPHCFNTLKNEYPQVAENFIKSDVRIVHHSHFIQELLEQKKLTLKKTFDGNITFHDPCYLTRYNDTVEEPREILVQLGGGKALREMKDSKKNNLCCGAGGGHFWFDMKVGERINVRRVDQAAETGADTIATGCPFCMQMMEDGVKMTDREETLKVRDIAELVADALG